MINNFINESIDKNIINKNRIKNLMIYSYLWDDVFYELFINNICDIYRKYRTNIIYNYALYYELFERYKPNHIIIPGEVDMLNIIPCQISKIFSAKSSLLLDGIITINDKRLYIKDNKNENYIFDYFFAYGNHNKKLLKKTGINENKIIKIKLPRFDKFKKYNKNDFKNIYDYVY